MSNPISSYDFIYHGMSDQDQERMRADIKKVITEAAENGQKVLVEAVQKAATSMYQELLANPWPLIIDENSGPYELSGAIAEAMWQRLLNSHPAKLNTASERNMKELIDAWSAAYPATWKGIVDEQAAATIEKLREQVAQMQQALSRSY
jgi:hypothetical protein